MPMSQPRICRRRVGRKLNFEQLEQRQLLAGDTYLVNFQMAGAATPVHYLADTGLMYGDRGGGLLYGWTSDHTDVSRERAVNLDQRLDTLIHFHANQKWEFGLPNGTYEVTASIGDPANPSAHTLNVEGVSFWNNVSLASNVFQQKTMTVTVADGRLTLDQGAAVEKATRIDFVHIVGLASGPNSAPSAPVITEPASDGQLVSPADVHMEATGFVDADGNAHKSTDWEIWTTGPGAQPVWQTLGIGGIEKLHTHFGDGVFINSRAGQTSLAANTDYQLRVRFRDDAGSVSAYSVRNFHTSASSATFPLELLDVATNPLPTWADSLGQPVDLPTASPLQPSLRLESAEAVGLLLSITASNLAGNTVNNPAPLADHADVRVVIQAGSASMNLLQSQLTFTDEHAATHTIYLPSLVLAANQRLDLWVGSDGSTYYGTTLQTVPDLSLLARASSNPFVALQPGYVVEQVGSDYRLPVNIAFVPNPGPNSTDPFYYVTELYGSIQVVRRDGTKQTFATGLLDYNPQGPISGTGEQGLTGIAVQRDSVNPDIYHLYVGMLWDNGSPPGNLTHYPKVERIDSVAGGLSMASRTVLLNMQPETQGQSHQISNISIGPDGKLYVHNGDGFDSTKGQDLTSFRGKVLRMNLDGSAPADNPFFNAADGITARDYVFAYGLRNPFGGAWRAADGKHYEVENGPSVDRFAQINRGVNYGYNGSDASMTINAIYNWNPAKAPVNIAFVQSATFAGSRFPESKWDHAFVSESGPTYATGPQANGKRIVEFTLDAAGNRTAGPTTLVEYRGTGQATVVGLAAGPDGLYFTELYEDSGANGATVPGARIFRVRYIGQAEGDYDYNGVVDGADFLKWQRTLGSATDLRADGNRSLIVDGDDLTRWKAAFPAAPPASAEVIALSLQAAAEGNGSVDRPDLVSLSGLATAGTPLTHVTNLQSWMRSERAHRQEAPEHWHDIALQRLLDRGHQPSELTPSLTSSSSLQDKCEPVETATVGDDLQSLTLRASAEESPFGQ
jgi:glucose/arabinose dehydrogenase